MGTETQFERLRARIARLRRRIDRQASRAVDQTARWMGWSSYISQFPGRSLVAAAGAGFAVATIFRKVRWPGRFGVRLYELAMEGAWHQIWDLVRQVSVDGSQVPDGNSSGGEQHD
jgi:hypothetical protein